MENDDLSRGDAELRASVKRLAASYSAEVWSASCCEAHARILASRLGVNGRAGLWLHIEASEAEIPLFAGGRSRAECERLLRRLRAVVAAAPDGPF